ncbi:MAG: Shedu anti-phage system protein SduA domain-containing protein [Candidatus Acidiferrales bacterium]
MLSVLLVAGFDSYMAAAYVERWKSQCIVATTKVWSLTSYLLLDLAAKHAMVDVIVFLPDEIMDDYAMQTLVVVEDVRKLPESCCMRDGRKWKKIPCVALSESRFMPYWHLLVEAGVSIVQYSTRFSFDPTAYQLQKVVDKYYEQVLADYRKVGILVDCEHGRCRVKWAYQKKDPFGEAEYYHSPADRRRLKDYVTVHRDKAGIAYEACLFEELINDPKTRERDLQRFFEQQPAFLKDAMQGVPISHSPRFVTPRDWTPDFVVPSVAATADSRRFVQLTELKGVHVPVLSGAMHRGLSHDVVRAIDQVRDYERVLRERHPANMKRVLDTFGYMPENFKMAVIIGRAPATTSEREILERRMAYVPDVRIVPYDEILQTQHNQMR